jgi:hypothetical protein
MSETTWAEWLEIDREHCNLYCEQIPTHIIYGTDEQKAEYGAQRNARERALLERLRAIFPDHPWLKRLSEL